MSFTNQLNFYTSPQVNMSIWSSWVRFVRGSLLSYHSAMSPERMRQQAMAPSAQQRRIQAHMKHRKV